VTANYRHGLALAAQRLTEVGALREEIHVQAATDVRWFYFGYSSYSTLTDENGWTLAQAEQWPNERACDALLR
jgi:hypothetical protein